MGYRNNIQDLTKDNTSDTDTVQNFGTAFAANSAAFNTLIDTNSNMAVGMKAIQQELNSTNTQLQQMHATGNQDPLYAAFQKCITTHQCHLQHQSRTNFRSKQQHTKKFQAPQAPIPAPHQQFYTNRGSGGGRGCGRGNRWGGHSDRTCDMPQYNTTYCPPISHPATPTQLQYPHMHPTGRRNGCRGGQHQPFFNATQIFANWNYCHSHGYDLSKDLNSTYWLNPGLIHI